VRESRGQQHESNRERRGSDVRQRARKRPTRNVREIEERPTT